MSDDLVKLREAAEKASVPELISLHMKSEIELSPRESAELHEFYRLASPAVVRSLLNRIEALAARVAKLEAALRPFIEKVQHVPGPPIGPNDEIAIRIAYKHVVSARAALGEAS